MERWARNKSGFQDFILTWCSGLFLTQANIVQSRPNRLFFTSYYYAAKQPANSRLRASNTRWSGDRFSLGWSFARGGVFVVKRRGFRGPRKVDILVRVGFLSHSIVRFHVPPDKSNRIQSINCLKPYINRIQRSLFSEISHVPSN